MNRVHVSAQRRFVLELSATVLTPELVLISLVDDFLPDSLGPLVLHLINFLKTETEVIFLHGIHHQVVKVVDVVKVQSFQLDAQLSSQFIDPLRQTSHLEDIFVH